MKNNYGLLLQITLVAIVGHFIAYEIYHIPRQIEFVIIVGIFLFYPLIRYPIIGVYIIFAFTPFIPYIRRLYYLVYGRPGTDPLIVLGDIIIIMVFTALMFEFKKGLSGEPQTKKYVVAIGIYFVYVIIRAFVFNIASMADGFLRLKFYAPVVLLFFIGMYFGREFKHLKRMWSITIIISCIGCAYGLKQLFIGYSAAEKLWFSSTYFTTLFIQGVARPFSLYQSPAAFADSLVIGIIAIVMIMFWGKFKGKIFLIGLIPLFFYGILITSVRSNWIGALSIFLFWFIVLQMHENKWRIAIIAAAVIGFIVFQFVDEAAKNSFQPESVLTILNGKLGNQEYVDLMVTSRAKALTNPFEENSMLSRLALWKLLFDMTKDPEMALLGRGVGTLNADSLYVTYLAEFGYPGLFFIVGLFCAFILFGIKHVGSLGDPRSVVLTKGIIVMDMVFALMNFTGTHIHTFPGDVYFWFWNGALMNVKMLDKKLLEESATQT